MISTYTIRCNLSLPLGSFSLFRTNTNGGRVEKNRKSWIENIDRIWIED